MDDVPNTNFLVHTPSYLKDISEHSYNTGYFLMGYIGNMKVKVYNEKIIIGDASLCKYYLGNNLQMLNRIDIGNAIEKLSDELHLPLNYAKVNNFEYGKNIITNYEPQSYFRYFGEKPYSLRLLNKDSIYYTQNTTQYVGYDKIKENKKNTGIIPLEFQNSHLLRLEKRYSRNIAKTFNSDKIVASMLFDKTFHAKIVSDWFCNYEEIHKIQRVKMDYNMINQVKQLQLLGVLYLMDLQGGEPNVFADLKEAYKRGDLTRKQKHDLQELYKRAANHKLLTIQSDEIIELNKKVKDSFLEEL
jgi:hypothetical protein